MELARHWRQKAARYRLEGARCNSCGAAHMPAPLLCAACGSESLEPLAFSGRGEVYSYTVQAQAPTGFETPLIAALVRLEEGPLISAQLTDVDQNELQIGMPVEMVTRRLRDLGEDGLILYGYKFRPLFGEN